MEEENTVVVAVRREGRNWMGSVTSWPNGNSVVASGSATTLWQLTEVIQKMASGILGVPQDKVYVSLELEDAALQHLIDRVETTRKAVVAARAEARTALAEAYTETKRELGITGRDLAELVDYSHQYIGKIGQKSRQGQGQSVHDEE